MEPITKIKKETFTERWDLTKELVFDKTERKASKWKRRLDGIARIIEGNSVCAAIMIEDRSFLIATNKQFPMDENTLDKNYLLINKFMQFLCNYLAEESHKDETFDDIFLEICSGALDGLKLPLYKKDKLCCKEFIELLKNDSKNNTNYKEFLSEKCEEGAHYEKDEAASFAVCSALLKDLKKLLKFINDHKNTKSQCFESNFIKAIENYDKTNIITKSKLEGKVFESEFMHAEMRIIAYLREKLKTKTPYQNYIGISKLCCLDCHLFIYAINNIFQNKICIRGAHNVSHGANWNAPLNITGKVPNLLPAKVPIDNSKPMTKSNCKEEPFSKKIIEIYKETYETQVIKIDGNEKKIGASSVSEYHDDSLPSSLDNEIQTINIEHEFIEGLQRQKLFLQQLLTIPGIVIDKKVFEVVEKLLKNFNEITIFFKTWKERWLFGFLKLFNENQNLKISTNEETKIAISILKNENFVGKLISLKVSEVFERKFSVKFA